MTRTNEQAPRSSGGVSPTTLLSMLIATALLVSCSAPNEPTLPPGSRTVGTVGAPAQTEPSRTPPAAEAPALTETPQAAIPSVSPAATPTVEAIPTLPNWPWRYGQTVENPPNEPLITYELYQQVTPGMLYEEVAVLFGRPGKEEHYFRSGDHSSARYYWENSDASYVRIWFSNGKVSVKNNRNLR